MKMTTYKIKDICDVINGRAYLQPELQNFGKYRILRVGNFFSSDKWYYSDMELPDNKYCYEGDLLFAWSASFGPKIWHGDKTIYHYHIWKMVPHEEVNKYYLYYWLRMSVENLTAGTHGSVMAHMTKNDLENFSIGIPDKNTQERVAAILASLDAKIECNTQINRNLEQQALAIFKSWFVDFEPFQDGKFVDSELGPIPDGWHVVPLDEIADFLNGLPMQKYRPDSEELGLPVLKIKELREQICSLDSERCTEHIKSEYIVEDGDIIFSWSGSLMVDIWTGGRCGLNQHLFKVTSTQYEKWFYYLWICHHMENFIAIAADKATTMGHIQRGHIHAALTLVPSKQKYDEMSVVISPIIDKMIQSRIESRRLATLRDTLLPKLMSGEIDVSEVEV